MAITALQRCAVLQQGGSIAQPFAGDQQQPPHSLTCSSSCQSIGSQITSSRALTVARASPKVRTSNSHAPAVQERLLERAVPHICEGNESKFGCPAEAHEEIVNQFRECANQVLGDVAGTIQGVTIQKKNEKDEADQQRQHDGRHEGRQLRRRQQQQQQQQRDSSGSMAKGQGLRGSSSSSNSSSSSSSKKRYAVSQGRRVQTVGGYTAMIVMYSRTARYKEAERMIEEMDFHGLVPDESNWLARIAAFGQQGKVCEAEKAFVRMQEDGRFSPDTATFNSMILLYGKARMYDRAHSTFRKMLENGNGNGSGSGSGSGSGNAAASPDEFTFRSMIGASGKSGKLKDALQLFGEMRARGFSPSSQNFSTLINLYGKARNAGGVLRTIQSMGEIGCKPDAQTLDASLRAMERANSGKLSAKSLDKLLGCLEDAGWSSSTAAVDHEEGNARASLPLLLNAYLKCHMLTKALETFRLMRAANLLPKDGTCRELISQSKVAGKVEEVGEYVFSEMEAAGVNPPSLETTCTMISALGLVGKVEQAERLYKNLSKSGAKLDIVTYNVMIDVYLRAAGTGPGTGSSQHYVTAAEGIFETVERLHPFVCPDSYTFHGMLRVYQRAGLYQKAVELYWKMVLAGTRLDEGLLNCVINCCGRTLPLEETSRLFQDMLDAGFSPNPVTFNLMIDIYGKAGFLEKARDVFRVCKEHGKVDSITYSTLINFLGKQRDFSSMEATAWEMQVRGLGRWAEAYNSMIDAYGKAGLLKQMEEVLERMRMAGCLHDVLTFNILINAYGKKGLMQELAGVLGQMAKEGKKPDLWTYNTLIGTYGHAEVPAADHVMSTFKEMQEAGIMPDRITYKNLVAALEKSGNLWEAARWSLWMTQAGFSTVTD